MEKKMGVVVRVTAATFALNLATKRAAEVTALTWYFKAHSLVKVAGLDGLSSLLGCLGLCLAFLSVACGTAMGSGVTMVMTKRETQPILKTGCAGLTVFLGCGVAGALLGSALLTLVSLGLRGFCLMGFLLSLGFILIHKLQPVTATPENMLTFSVVTFITIHLGVRSCQGGISDEPKLSCAVLLLFPAAFLMGFLAELLAFRKPSYRYMTLSFMLLVPVAGLLLGLGIESYSSGTPRFHETFYTVRSLMYTVGMLSGLIGALFGAMSVNLWEAEQAEWLSLWISVPTGVILYALDADPQHLNLHSLTESCLLAGGQFGLTSGLVAASGVSLGLAVMSTQEQLWSRAVLILGVVSVAAHNDLISFDSIVVPLALPFAPELLNNAEHTVEHDRGNKVSVLMEAALSFAIVGMAMMGATMLGAAGLLTASLGSAGFYGVTLAICVTLSKAFILGGQVVTVS